MTPVEPLYLYTIYYNPSDYPGMYVARRFTIGNGSSTPDPEPLVVATTLDLARRAIPFGLFWINRQAGDDPVILETWI